MLSFGIYTAVKASFLSTTLAIRVEERNLIYLSPIAFVAAGRWILSARFTPASIAASGLAVGYLLWTTPYHAYEHLYSDAFGLSILQWLNQKWYWTNTDLKRLLFAILVLGALCTIAMRWRQRAARPIAVAALVLSAATIGWNLTGEIAAANGSVGPAKAQRSLLPTPPDWVDDATGRARTMFFGKALANSYWLWSFEFWNQSIQDVWSVDASVPPPGPGVTPNFLDTRGTLDPQLPVRYVLTQPAIVMVGRIKESEGGVNLYTVPHPIRASSFISGITADGWMQDYSRFVRLRAETGRRTSPPSLRSHAGRRAVRSPTHISRSGVSSLRIDGDGQPVAAKRERVSRVVVAPVRGQRVLRIPARAPFRLDATATRLFHAGDGRDLSAFVGYSFTPARARRSRSGCLRTKRAIPAQCQSVRRVSQRVSVTALCSCATTAAGTYQRSQPARIARYGRSMSSP